MPGLSSVFGIEILTSLINELGKNDVVLASKYAGKKSKVSLLREISSRSYRLLCRSLFDVHIKDIGSGFVILKKTALDGIDLESDGFDIHIELFTKLKRKGSAIKEMPAEYNYNGYSTFSIFRHGPRVIINTLRFWLKSR